MSIALLVLAVAFGACCIWLTVRIVNRRERWAKWTAVALVLGLPLLYVLSIGPMCWFSTPHTIGIAGPARNPFASSEDRAIVLPNFYSPIGRMASRSDLVAEAVRRFGHAGGSTMPIVVPTSLDGSRTIVLE